MKHATDLTPRQIAAIRACGFHPRGLRISAYPRTMPELEIVGLVERRPMVNPAERRRMGWFLTPDGKERLRLVGMGEPEH